MSEPKVIDVDEKELCRIARSVLQGSGFLAFSAFGVSMEPAIHSGDTLRIVGAGVGVRSGEVVLYATPDGRAVCHRVVKTARRKGKRCLLVCGDNAPDTMCLIDESDVLGRLVSIKSSDGRTSKQTKLRCLASLVRLRIKLVCRRLVRGSNACEDKLVKPVDSHLL